ncbi:Hypothetical predicted protein, partial [Olea europaea subsp. europaea]
MARSRSVKRGEKVGSHNSNTRGKRKFDDVQKDSSSKRHKSSCPATTPPAKKLEICDLEPLEDEMAMSYMIEV